MKLLIFSPPFSGHLNVLDYLKNEFLLANGINKIKLVITSWKNIKTNINENENTIILEDENIMSSDPMTFTLSRSINLTKKCIDICKNFKPHLIIYDFFSLEGFITAKNMSIPCFCSIPAMIGPYNKNNEFFKLKLYNNENIEYINKINVQYSVNLLENNIQQVSDGILIPSDVNIVWSFDKVIECDNYLENRNLSKNNFVVVGPRKSINQNSHIHKQNNKKIIYVSFGTVVSQNLWNNNQEARNFVNDIYDKIIDIFKDNKEFDVIIATNRKDLPIIWPDCFNVHKYVDQLEILSRTHIFITHCGGNSFSESINNNVPMIGIPFFGDQHLIAQKINKLELGISFQHNDQFANDQYVDTENNPYFRKSLTNNNLKLAIEKINNNYQKYIKNISDVVTNTSDLSEIIQKYNNYPLKWNNGDLLYGTNVDRTSLITFTNTDSDFRICIYQPFSKLFHDNDDSTLLPRIIDIYNDGLIDDNNYSIELTSNFTQYSQNLKEFRLWLNNNKQFIAPVNSLGDITDGNKSEVIWNMCLGGIEFFTQVKGYTIHFVLESYSKINKATTLELDYINKNWERLKSKICFYKLDSKNGILSKVNPELYGIIY